MEKKYQNIGYWFILLIPLTLLAFYKPYFQFFPEFSNVKSGLHLHTAIAVVWLGLLIVQPILIRHKKYKTHKLIGKFSYLWFPVFIASFIPLMLAILRSDFPQAIYFSLADLTLLITFYSLAIYHRKYIPLHMRYMILTTIVFLGPTVGRIGGIWFGLPLLMSQAVQYFIIALILTVLIVRDDSRKKSKPYFIGALAYLLHAIGFYIVFT